MYDKRLKLGESLCGSRALADLRIDQKAKSQPCYYFKTIRLLSFNQHMSHQRLEFSESFTKRQLKEIAKVIGNRVFSVLPQDRINGINVPHY